MSNVPEKKDNADQSNQARSQVQVDDTHASAGYANFCRVIGTPEEVILDFGLNPQPMGASATPIPVTHRIVTNLFTAKRLLHALGMTIQRHEAAYGPLEIDVTKRMRNQNQNQNQ
ncbi:MAG: DUF3467 domain-containing protein [Thermoguttaceae bacterium]|nr:DUF3467 domain-containing protein [Thermoguttaceae bacterium]